MKKIFLIAFLFTTVFSFAAGRGTQQDFKADSEDQILGSSKTSAASEGNWKIGAGIADITGPAAEVEMSGYAMTDQLSHGIHTRLFARAFVLEDKSGNRVVYCVNDGAWISQAAREEVVRNLSSGYWTAPDGKIINLTRPDGKPYYTTQNVMISATHSHSALAANSHYTMYNFMSAGYNDQSFRAVVDGITAAIVSAHQTVKPGSIQYGTDYLNGDYNVSWNRSIEPFLANPEYKDLITKKQFDLLSKEDQRKFLTSDAVLDKRMTEFKLVGSDGKDIGLINWFGVHPTCLSNSNKLISGDSKGVSSLWMEDLMGSPEGRGNFVAAFALGAAGDACNVAYTEEDPTKLLSPESQIPFAQAVKIPDEKKTEFKTLDYVSRRIFDKAVSIYCNPKASINGEIMYGLTYLDMTKIQVDLKYAYKPEKYAPRTWPAAVGFSMSSGAENGPSFEAGFYEGMTYPLVKPTGLAAFSVGLQKFLKPSRKNMTKFGLTQVMSRSDELQAAQSPKPVMFATGEALNTWTPQIVPVQIYKIGDIVLLGMPHELTTTTSKRLQAQVIKSFEERGIKITQCITPAVTNTYCHYMATPEEYELQNYEGATTHFGINQLPAYLQEIDRMIGKLVAGKSGVQPDDPIWIKTGVRDMSHQLWGNQPGVLRDTSDGKFGSMITHYGKTDKDLKKSYKPGEVLKTSFRTGHLKNDLRTGSSYFYIQRQDPSTQKWYNVRSDTSTDTKYKWEEVTVSSSVAQVIWQIPSYANPGAYRIVHQGSYKENSKKFVPYSFVSPAFSVEAVSNQVGPTFVTVESGKKYKLDVTSGFSNIVIRQKAADSTISGAQLTLSNGRKILVGAMSGNGEAKIIRLAAEKDVQWIEFDILATNGLNIPEVVEFSVF